MTNLIELDAELEANIEQRAAELIEAVPSLSISYPGNLDTLAASIIVRWCGWAAKPKRSTQDRDFTDLRLDAAVLVADGRPLTTLARYAVHLALGVFGPSSQIADRAIERFHRYGRPPVVEGNEAAWLEATRIDGEALAERRRGERPSTPTSAEHIGAVVGRKPVLIERWRATKAYRARVEFIAGLTARQSKLDDHGYPQPHPSLREVARTARDRMMQKLALRRMYPDGPVFPLRDALDRLLRRRSGRS
jgi:hypothetical protein